MDPRDGRLNPINSALLIKESCTRSDSNIILRESEKLIQLIHDKQFHLIMIGHPHEFFSFRGFLLSLSSYCFNVSWKIPRYKIDLSNFQHHHGYWLDFCLLVFP